MLIAYLPYYRIPTSDWVHFFLRPWTFAAKLCGLATGVGSKLCPLFAAVKLLEKGE